MSNKMLNIHDYLELDAERAQLEDLRIRYDSIREKFWKTEDELAAECRRREQKELQLRVSQEAGKELRKEVTRLTAQLLSAQAALEKHNFEHIDAIIAEMGLIKP